MNDSIEVKRLPGLKNLPFPLNIYSLLLDRVTGKAEHLHYGHYDYPGEPVEVAQARAVELLRSHLPAQGKVLEVGCGFGSLTNLLSHAGYDVTGITPDPIQNAVAKARHGAELSVKCLRLEDFLEEEGTWDLLLLHESGQYIPMLDLFERASRLLKTDGQILVLDEFACKRTEPGLENLHYKDYFLAIANRFGFTCLKELDCTVAAMPTLDFLISSLTEHCSELAVETGVGLHALDALICSCRSYMEKYRSGRFGYFLLHLQRQSIPPWRLNLISEEDQPAVGALFEKVFSQPLSPEMWRWKYKAGQAIGLWEAGELIAHYGGIPRQLNIAGTQMTASQSCDVMVAPHVRGALVRRGPFFQVCATFLEHFVGYGTDQPLAFGFPNERAFRLPRILGLYTDPVTRIHEFSWAVGGSKNKMWTMRSIDPSESDDAAIINKLWKKMSCELGYLVIGVRDATYWCSRYQDHPQIEYEMYLVCHRWFHKPLAVLAVKKDGDRLELLDWVAAINNVPEVVMAGRYIADRIGVREVYLWASLPVKKYLAETSPAEKDINIPVPYNGWTSSPDKEVLQDKLWLTGGDTDFH